MTELTEFGDVMINSYLDEWGRRKIDSLLEDGVRIIVVAAPPPVVVKPIVIKKKHLKFDQGPHQRARVKYQPVN